MSSSGITPLNSAPLLIRTYLDGSSNNTYALGPYENSVSSNRILITSTAGLIAPSDNIYISSISISSINGLPYPPVDDALWSLVGSTVVNDNPGPVQITGNLICSSITNISSIFGPGILNISTLQGTFIAGREKISQFGVDASTADATLVVANSASGRSINFLTNCTAGAYNSITNVGDLGIMFNNGAIDTGNLWIGPWASGVAKGIKILTNGNVGIGAAAPSTTLQVAGTLSTNTIVDNSGSSGTSGQVLTAGAGGQVTWAAASTGGYATTYILKYPTAPVLANIPLGSGTATFPGMSGSLNTNSNYLFTLNFQLSAGSSSGRACQINIILKNSSTSAILPFTAFSMTDTVLNNGGISLIFTVAPVLFTGTYDSFYVELEATAAGITNLSGYIFNLTVQQVP